LKDVDGKVLDVSVPFNDMWVSGKELGTRYENDCHLSVFANRGSSH